MAGTALLFAGVAAYKGASQLTYETIDSTTTQVQSGETITDAVEDAMNKLADEHGIDMSSISGGTATAQELQSDANSTFIQPGYSVHVDLQKNLFGDERITPHHEENEE